MVCFVGLLKACILGEIRMKKSIVFGLLLALGATGSAFAADINDQIEVNGEVRYNYMSKRSAVNEGESYEAGLRSRVELKYKPTEKLAIAVMGENEHDFRAGRGANHHDIRLKQAYVETEMGKVNLTLGRFGIGVADGAVLDDDLSRMDSVLVGYELNDKLKLEGFGAQALDGREDEFKGKKRKMYGGRITYAPVDKLEIKGEYVQFKDFLGEVEGEASNYKNKVFALSASYEPMEDMTVAATFIRGKASGDEELEAASKNGLVLELGYKGAEATEKGSWGVKANYYNQGGQSYMAQAIDGNTEWAAGFKGWSLSADYAIAKNVVAKVAYYDTRDKGDSGEKDHRFWTDVTFTF